MAIVIDTSAIYAMYDADSRRHAEVKKSFSFTSPPYIVPTAILAEIGYMLAKHLGELSVRRFLKSIEIGALQLSEFVSTDVERCYDLLVQYKDLNLGLADVSIVATAERLNIQTILTLDERHFRVIRPHGFDHFILYPADFHSE